MAPDKPERQPNPIHDPREEDDSRLLSLASRIDEHQPIDWDAEERRATSDEERKILAEMRLLAKAADLFRDPEASAGEPALTRWGTLVVGEPIGRGAFGTVYRAQDNLSRDVALKLFPPPQDAHASDDHATRLLREGRLLARVRHQNVVTVFGVDRHEGRIGLWMERIHGRTLEEELRARGVCSAEEAALIGRDLCRALAAVHAAGLLHRDVKAQNVMREQGGRIVLMDFGAGSDQRAIAPGHSGSPVDVAGTPLYLAPEVFEGLPASEASDIYSLGVLLYHLVTGAYPVEGQTRSEIRRKHRQSQHTRLRDARPDLPDGFVQVIERAIAPDPSRRYDTAGELEDALSHACALPPSAQPAQSLLSAPHANVSTDRERSTSTPVSPALDSAANPAAGKGPGFKRSLILVGAAIVTTVLATILIANATFKTPVTASANSGAPASAASPAVGEGSYSVRATFYKDVDGRQIDLSPGDRVTLGDSLGLRVEATAPVYLYVANQDERGEAFLLFPLPAQTLANPLAPGLTHHLPGPQVSGDDRWQVTSSGEQEHFVVMASPTPIAALKAVMDALPPAQTDRPASAIRLAPDLRMSDRPASELVGQTRGIGGLARSRPAKGGQGLRDLFAMADALPKERETVRGLWVRTFTLENPVRAAVERPVQR